MSNRLMAALVGMVLAALLAASSGCSRQSTRYTMTVEFIGDATKALIRPSGPRITVGVDFDQNGVFTFDGHEVIVGKHRILLDGKEQAKVPAGAKKVVLEYVAGKLTTTVDGAPLAIADPAK